MRTWVPCVQADIFRRDLLLLTAIMLLGVTEKLPNPPKEVV